MINLRGAWVACVFVFTVFFISYAVNMAVVSSEPVNTSVGGITEEKQVQLLVNTDGISKKGYAELLVNGELYCILDSERETISVNFGDIIEIDSRKIKKPVSVRIAGISDNVDLQNFNTDVYINAGIQVLGKIVEK